MRTGQRPSSFKISTASKVKGVRYFTQDLIVYSFEQEKTLDSFRRGRRPTPVKVVISGAMHDHLWKHSLNIGKYVGKTNVLTSRGEQKLPRNWVVI